MSDMETEPKKNPHAVIMGRKGGRAKSEAKARAVRENGKKGGRPKKLQVAHEEPDKAID